MSRLTAVRGKTHDLWEMRVPVVPSFQLFSYLIPILFYLPICVLLFKQELLSVFSILLYVSVFLLTLSIWRAPWAPHPQTGRLAYMCITMCIYVRVYLLLRAFYAFLIMNPSISQIVGNILCVYWQVTWWIGRQVFIRHYPTGRTLACIFVCSSAPSATGMPTQQLWLLLTVTTGTGCMKRLSEDPLLHLHRKVRRSQMKQDIAFLSQFLPDFLELRCYNV